MYRRRGAVPFFAAVVFAIVASRYAFAYKLGRSME
jgi:hypothetical protein